VDFRAGELKITIMEGRAIQEALNPRERLAFVAGRLSSSEEARELASRGDVACAVHARGRFKARVEFAVVRIKDNSHRQGQSVTLTTEDGLQISCQSERRQPLTPQSVKRAFGSVLEIR